MSDVSADAVAKAFILVVVYGITFLGNMLITNFVFVLKLLPCLLPHSKIKIFKHQVCSLRCSGQMLPGEIHLDVVIISLYVPYMSVHI